MNDRLAEQIKRVRNSGFTVAPEAATERMRRVMMVKPPYASTSSTMVMAPIRKNRMLAISPRNSSN